MQDINFASWIDGIPTLEEDHVFIPIGAQSDRLTELYNERANLLEKPKEPEEEGLTGGGERSLAESFTDRRAEIDRLIAEQLEEDHPDAPRIRLRGVSDTDVEEINDEIAAIQVEGKPLSRDKARIEQNIRFVARAAIIPEMTPQDVRILRKKLNRGEWSRLLDHVTTLTFQESEGVDVPNS